MSVSYFPGNRSESDSSVSTGPTLYFRKQPSIESFFPPYKSESETDGSTISESNKTTLAAAQLWSYPIDLIFPPANSNKSDTDDGSSVSNEPTPDFSKRLSIQLIFPPYMSESDTNENYETQSPYSIVSFFPPARSSTDSSKYFEIIPIDTSKATTMDSDGYILEIYFSSQQSVPIHDMNSSESREFHVYQLISQYIFFRKQEKVLRRLVAHYTYLIKSNLLPEESLSKKKKKLSYSVMCHHFFVVKYLISL